MFNAIIGFSIRHRYAVLIVTSFVAIVGVVSYKDLIIDAVPDITNVQVQINTEADGYSPFEVEQRVTTPLELSIVGLPSLEYTRSISKYGLSQITAVFKDGTDIYFARQLLSQRLQEAATKLPERIRPSMGPIATGLGEIFMFTIENDRSSLSRRSLEELRDIQDWVVRPQIITVEGVVEVNSIGGAAKQVVVNPKLDRLRSYGMTLEDLSRAIADNNSNVGAAFVESHGEQLLMRVPGQVENYRDMLGISVGVHEGVVVRVGDVADVAIGSELRAGAATQNGEEIVLGTVFMLIGENGLKVSQRVAQRIKEAQSSLPEGVLLKPVYNRAELVNATVSTVRLNLFEGALLVIAVLFASLRNFRAALLTAAVIPLSMLMTITGMVSGKLSANLMSLGALDFGLIVDGAVILVENCITRLSDATQRLKRRLTTEERLSIIQDAAAEVRQATMFGELIIMVVYVPILTLGGIEGKMFRPMALTVLLALAAAFVLSLTFVPAAVAVLVRAESSHTTATWVASMTTRYRALLRRLIQTPGRVLGGAVTILLTSAGVFLSLGSEFMPSLDEGDVALHALRAPGTSLSQSVKMQFQLEDAIKEVPEVDRVFAKIGTAEIATDPMPPSVADGYVILKPRSKWADPSKPKAAVVQDLERKANGVPGSKYEFTQPIEMRFNELIAGVRTDVAFTIFGDDPDQLQESAGKVASVIGAIPGAADVRVEQVSGLPQIEILPRRDVIGRMGVNISEVQDAVSVAYAGREVSRFYQGPRSIPVVVRLGEGDRNNVENLKRLPIPLPIATTKAHDPFQGRGTGLEMEESERLYTELGVVASIVEQEGPNQISHENGRRRIVVTANVRGRDVGSFVAEAQTAITSGVTLPRGYWSKWGGQYEHLIGAERRLMVVVPIVLLCVFGLIVVTFRSLRYSLLVFSGIPFALSGGVLALWILGIPFSISAAVGFIALSGVSVLNGLVLVTFVRQLIARGVEPLEAIIEGTIARVRPVLMTALVASLGFVPMAISTGTGSEVQRPLATVVIGGIISATTLTLLVLPVLLAVFARDKSSRE